MRSEHDRIRDEWEAVAGGWRRWEPLFQSFTWPVALRMVAVAQIGAGQRVLDVGCGIGDPTLQVAVLVGPHGHVLGIDLVEEMLATGRERAVRSVATALRRSKVERDGRRVLLTGRVDLERQRAV